MNKRLVAIAIILVFGPTSFQYLNLLATTRGLAVPVVGSPVPTPLENKDFIATCGVVAYSNHVRIWMLNKNQIFVADTDIRLIGARYNDNELYEGGPVEQYWQYSTHVPSTQEYVADFSLNLTRNEKFWIKYVDVEYSFKGEGRPPQTLKFNQVKCSRHFPPAIGY